jgi:dipeptidase E
MKKLFLASFASVSIELVIDLLPKPANQLKAAFIPTAGDPYDNKDFVYVDREAIVKMGMTVVDIDLKTTKGYDLEKALHDIDVILVAGGNTFYLLDQAKKSGFDSIVKKCIERGVIYIGSSAGSILCCPTVEGAKRFDSPADAPDLADYTGLDLIDFVIIPHAQKEKYKDRIRETIDDMNGKELEVKTLTDNQAIIINDDNVKIVEIPLS